MEMAKVWTFFYGSFINLDVLKKLGVVPERYEVARLNGFDIRIQPVANLIRSDQGCVYGIVVLVTHDDLRRLYDYVQTDLAGIYLPEPVLVETLDGKWKAALCYISPAMEPRTPTNEYIERIVGPAKQYGFPNWYIARLDAFRS
jgi:hypothetical protein